MPNVRKKRTQLISKPKHLQPREAEHPTKEEELCK